VNRRRLHAARRQAALLAVIVLAVGAVSVLAAQRPASEDELRIPIAELRSQSFELKLLADESARGRAQRFVEAHARQLAKAIERSRDDLTALPAPPRLAAARAAGLERSAVLPDIAAQLGKDRAVAAAAMTQLADAGARLQALEQSLQR
jgi:hypothetical protein